MSAAVDEGELAHRIATAAEGDAEAEAELCRRLRPRIRAYGRRHLGDADAGEELAQDVLMAVISNLRAGRVAAPARIHGYVLSTCRRSVARIRRDQGRRRELIEQAAPWLATVGSTEPEQSEVDLARLALCLDRLEVRARGAVIATFFAEESAPSIAASLGTTAGNVRVLRHRALRSLHTCMTESS